jgi:hypothetical protein
MVSVLSTEKSEAPDTESLLREGQPEDLLATQQARRNKRLKTSLHLVAIIFYSSITIYLYLWSARLSATECESKSAAVYCEHRMILFLLRIVA